MSKNFFLISFSIILFLLLFNIISAELIGARDLGKNLFESKCSFCHSTVRATTKIENKDYWLNTVKKMQSKNSDLVNDSEAEKIVSYLSYGNGEVFSVYKIKDPYNLSELEKEHIPVIRMGALDPENETIIITVNFGEISHPMDVENYIKYIELYIDGKLLGRVDLKPGDNPEAVFYVIGLAGKRLSVREECNCPWAKWKSENN